jgi:predicted acetyltransferase
MEPVSLVAARAPDRELIENLLELYIHDMSEAHPHVHIARNGRFGYPRLALYWSEPDQRSAFLIKYGDRIAGFALVTRGSPISDDPDCLDVAEFFVLRQYRRAGVGRAAAFLLWRQLPGTWTVRVLESNRGAVAFWSDVVREFTNGTSNESLFTSDGLERRAFTFDSR